MIQHLQCRCGSSKAPCGCCEGIEATTPVLVANRPGLGALAYRVGTHSSFLETMLARLSTLCLGSEEECRASEAKIATLDHLEHTDSEGIAALQAAGMQPVLLPASLDAAKKGLRPLLKLTSRDTGDPSIALLDAWAIVADVLTFYQERIANEGYLRTATERRSVIELGRLVGYRLRPGVAASVYLALTIEKDEKVAIEPYEVRAQSVPGPGELPQSFENIEKIEARGRWNKLGPRLTRPQNQQTLQSTQQGNVAKLYFKGIATGLNQGDPLLVTGNPSPLLLRIVEVNVDAAADRTQVLVESWLATGIAADDERAAVSSVIAGFKNPGLAKPSLDNLSAALAAGSTNAQLADLIENETLPKIASIAARRNIGRPFRDRLRGLSAGLAKTIEPLRASAIAAPTAVTLGLSGAAGRPVTASTIAPKAAEDRENEVLRSVIDGLTKPVSVPPANTLRFGRDPVSAFQPHSDLGVQALGVFRPPLLDSLPTALGNTAITNVAPPAVYAFRVKASLFGHSAPPRTRITEIDRTDNEPKHTDIDFIEWTAADVRAAEDFIPNGNTEQTLSNVLYLDGSYEKILPESWIVVDTGAIDPEKTSGLRTVEKNTPFLFGQALKVEPNISRAKYGVSGKTTRIEIMVASRKAAEAAWMQAINDSAETADDFQMIRRTIAYAQAEELTLSEEPIEEEICTTEENEGWIVLDGVYSELKSGRWVIVEGERSDLADGFGNRITGVKGTELAMLAEVVHDFDSGIPGDTAHTQIKLAARLEYCYTRDKVTIYANVVKATHGETRNEVLGSGDGSKSLQEFALKQPPLTYVSATTPAGVASTLKLFVNDVEWHETQSIFGLEATDRRFVTSRSDAEVTTAIFGNGKQGARLPTGAENIRARYRQGIGKGGNVAEGKISLLAARPLSVKEVINPRRASGGADPESREQARENTPLAVQALDRLVSTPDYSDFARTFGGVGKAFSMRLSDGTRELVHVTIAGADDAPIEEDSELLRNLRLSLVQFGDPALPVSVAVRELMILVVSAGVRLLPDYVWEKVAPGFAPSCWTPSVFKRASWARMCC